MKHGSGTSIEGMLRLGSWSVLLGVTAGIGIAVLRVTREHYLQQGLHALAANVLSDSVIACLGAALLGGLCGAPFLLASRRPALSAKHRVRSLMLGVGAALPVLLVLARLRREDWLFPEGYEFAVPVTVLAALSLGAVGIALLGRRFGNAIHLYAGAATALALALVATTVSKGDWLRAPVPEGAPNVLLVVLDTVRADRLSSYGNPRRTTPELDAFAERAIRYSNFYSTSSWTVPSHASLFTGLYAVDHGATQERVRLDARYATLAEILRNGGYRTFGVSGNPWVGPRVNLSQGFESFTETWREELGAPPAPRRGAHPANVAFEAFLESSDSQRPFFAFVHYMDAHAPFLPPEPYRSRFLPARTDPVAALRLAEIMWIEYYRGRAYSAEDLAILSDLYDGGLAYLSSVVGRLLEALEESGDYDDTLIVVTADHGEHFGENNLLGHMFGLYNTAVQVPLLLRLPGGARAGEVDSRKGQLVDLFTTLITAAGLADPALPHSGISLLAEPGETQRQSVFSEYYYPAQVLSQFSPDELEQQAAQIEPYQRRMRAIERYGFRFIWSSNGRHEFYDLRADPLEVHNLYSQETRDPVVEEFLALLKSELALYVPEPDAHAPEVQGQVPELDADTLEALRAVGYVQ